MSNATLGVWIRRFLLEHLVAERNLARNTQRSYRDTLVLLIPFVAAKLGKPLDRLTPIDLCPILCVCSLRTWKNLGSAPSQPVTRGWLHSMHWLASSASAVQSISSGAARCVPSHSKRQPRESFHIWTSQRWMRFWRHRIARPLKDSGVITLSSCFSTTQVLAPTRRLSWSFVIYTLLPYSYGSSEKATKNDSVRCGGQRWRSSPLSLLIALLSSEFS